MIERARSKSVSEHSIFSGIEPLPIQRGSAGTIAMRRQAQERRCVLSL